jgi:hypothetical protein
MQLIGMDRRFQSLRERVSTPRGGKECKMRYSITLRSRTDATIAAWYDGSDSRWSTDRQRQKLFDNRRDAKPLCQELRNLCPRNAKVINIEVEQDNPTVEIVPPMFARQAEC